MYYAKLMSISIKRLHIREFSVIRVYAQTFLINEFVKGTDIDTLMSNIRN